MRKTIDRFDVLVSGLIFILLLMAGLVAQAAFAEDEWKILGLSSKGILLYNSESLAELSAGGKGVWTKFVYNDAGLRPLKSQGGKFAGLLTLGSITR